MTGTAFNTQLLQRPLHPWHPARPKQDCHAFPPDPVGHDYLARSQELQIVSCQVLTAEPMERTDTIVAIAKAASAIATLFANRSTTLGIEHVALGGSI
ncbi:hypothetical protein GCM10016455_05040 [Aliiroseovarius zhejiangensis]|uniref:Uncharacterized protein n=1 Tax=Aliiroseovarius zhejiangensis TaxID=1632025 RepID=A0ABQ3IQ56_9RHOB|nr:hypothetical protein [Aliiroseovarius zhejiangensis]GHE88009.1 hypothetical protein GCM10016455_05040 [Aliiroseovarius zhejiangensis]